METTVEFGYNEHQLVIIIIIIIFISLLYISVMFSFSKRSQFLQRLQCLFGPKGGHGLEHEVRLANR